MPPNCLVRKIRRHSYDGQATADIAVPLSELSKLCNPKAKVLPQKLKPLSKNKHEINLTLSESILYVPNQI